MGIADALTAWRVKRARVRSAGTCTQYVKITLTPYQNARRAFRHQASVTAPRGLRERPGMYRVRVPPGARAGDEVQFRDPADGAPRKAAVRVRREDAPRG